MAVQEINEGLEVKKVNGLRFGNELAHIKPVGYALYHEELGFLSFKEDNAKLEYGAKKPYTPQGGKKALKAILESGGLSHYDNIEWVQPI